MYYYFSRPPPSFVVLARYSIPFHKLSRPLLSVRHLLGVKENFFPYGVVRTTSSQCLQISFSLSLSLVSCGTFLVKAWSCAMRRLISCCCLTTVSTDTARIAAYYASRPPGSAVWVAAAEILFRYPSSKSII